MLKIVIVEDETNIRDCLVHLFPWDSLDVTVSASFSSGEEALSYLSDHSADILLTDIRLPEMNGLDLVQALRISKNPISVIILTAYRHFDYAQQAIRYNVDDFLLKPIKYNELTASILRIRESLENSPSKPAAAPAEDASYHEKIISSSKHYVADHLTDVTLENTALSVSLSPGYFSRLFHKVTGSTFSDYVTACRMEKAAKLLKEIDYKTYEISLLVGYDNPKNFTRAFKQYYQMTPREYRTRTAALTQEDKP